MDVKTSCGEYILNLKIRNEWDMASGMEEYIYFPPPLR